MENNIQQQEYHINILSVGDAHRRAPEIVRSDRSEERRVGKEC